MKRVFAVMASMVLALCAASAQDINEATDLYNAGAEALISGNKVEALEYLTKAKAIADECGEDGASISANCDLQIPQLNFGIGQDFVKAGKFDEAIAQLYKTIEVAKSFNDDAVVAKAEKLIPQVYTSKGNAALKAKDYAGAIEDFKAVLELNPTNGKATLLLGQAYDKAGDVENAKLFYKQAIDFGMVKEAVKQLQQLEIKDAAAALKAKKYKDALAAAKNALEYGPSDKANRIAGQAAMELGDKKAAIDYFNAYLELAPAANDAPTIRQAVEALEKQLNPAKAQADDED